MVNSQSEIELKPNETQPTLEELQAELERTKSALKKANSESANHRHKAKELDDLKSKIEQEKLSETERLQAKLAEKEQLIIKHQERVIRSEMKTAAVSLGIINPATATKLIDWSEIEYDDNGDPTNVEDLLKKLIKDEPYLVGKQQTSTSRTSVTNPPRSASGSSDIEELLDRLQQGKLKDTEYAALPLNVRNKLAAMMSTRKYTTRRY